MHFEEDDMRDSDRELDEDFDGSSPEISETEEVFEDDDLPLFDEDDKLDDEEDDDDEDEFGGDTV